MRANSYAVTRGLSMRDDRSHLGRGENKSTMKANAINRLLQAAKRRPGPQPSNVPTLPERRGAGHEAAERIRTRSHP